MKPVGELVHLTAEGPQAIDDGVDPVALLDAQLAGPAHPRLTTGRGCGDETQAEDRDWAEAAGVRR